MGEDAMRWAWALAMGAGVAGAAEGWAPAADVAALLAGRSVAYAGAQQSFRADGGTTYVASRPTEGAWEVRDGRYCSVWPPATRWVCYDVEVSGDGARVRFVTEAGDVTEGTFRE